MYMFSIFRAPAEETVVAHCTLTMERAIRKRSHLKVLLVVGSELAVPIKPGCTQEYRRTRIGSNA